jgi:hypothetical protein
LDFCFLGGLGFFLIMRIVSLRALTELENASSRAFH